MANEQNLLFLIPLFPIVGAFIMGLWGRRMSRIVVGTIGSASVALSFLVSLFVGARCVVISPTPVLTQKLWTWISIGNFQPQISLRLDSLSLIMTLVVCFVGFLIHLYSIEFMADDPGFSRFFSYMNLFVASMLLLVLGDNLLLLYLGWEGVGLCSYLLIGFWFQDPANGLAARKAFIMTRIGDTALAIALFILYKNFGTLEIQDLLVRAKMSWPVGSGVAVTVAALILGGAVGKSAQLPLQTWLPDAMAGPTPVSALIHAATMVTAGVYLIARTHTIFELAPTVQFLVALIGTVTLLISAFSALCQTDIKRILAYSTMSQVGYMFLALGVGAWSAAIFHFMTHAFFKALLFLAAGAVINAVHHEHDIFKMGGLRRQIPGVFWPFLIGAASLSALPIVTAGFYSKDLILTQTYFSSLGGGWLWTMGLVGALLTSVYSFRLIFVVFFGEEHVATVKPPGALISLPLLVLSILAIMAGAFTVPEFLQKTIFPAPLLASRNLTTGMVALVASLVSLAGIGAAAFIYVVNPAVIRQARKAPLFQGVSHFFYSGWGFDWLYDKVFVRPYVFISRINRDDFIDLLFDGVAWFNFMLNRALTRLQTGQLRWYAALIGAGAAVLILLAEGS